ncbi:hypothetical protein [Ensifer sp. ENS11]|uniref:capsular polysaccharide export protein, LipB/KpsS family n=1 Tax=Ensifer sp. ENS11 TaxID=2769291 RepID=UPI001785248B|nr:hypothetical protein [Ensifer sp. ENS11]MBD9491642.1 hypothetical protein [Ensifer sp. ENS11]
MNATWYKTFLDVTARQWEAFPEITNDGVILIDLTHDWIEYLLYSLLIAKGLQLEKKCKIVGFCLNTSVVAQSCPKLNISAIREIARAHGVHEVIYLSKDDFEREFGGTFRKAFTIIEDMLQDDNEARHFINDVDKSRAHILTCAYESALRAGLIPSCEGFGREIFEATLEAKYVDEYLSTFFNTENVVAVVAGHMDYNPWRLACHHATLRAIPIYNFFTGRTVSVWRLAPSADEPFGATKARANAAAFEASKEALKNSPWAYGHSTLAVPTKGWSTIPTSLSAAGARPLLKRYFANRYPWRDGKPIVSVFAHTFSDIPCSDAQVFRDHSEWLRETLSFAACDESKNWIIRPHPLDKVYDRTGLIDQLREQYAEVSNIHFADASQGAVECFSMSDLIITVRGTIGIEASAAGIPCILAGAAPYSRCGFSRPCHTREEYFSLLSGSEIPVMSDRERWLAQAFLLFESTLANVQSEALPEICSFWVDEMTYFQEASERLSRYSIERDPFMNALRAISTAGEGRFVWPISLSEPNERPALTSSDGFPLYFTPWRSGIKTTVDGFHSADESGTWSSKVKASILLPAARENVRRLSLTGRKLLEHQNVSVRTLSGALLTVDWTDKDFQTVDLDVAGQLDGEDNFTILEFEVSEVLCPAAIGLNGDTRLLGFCLQSLGISYD